MPEHIPVAVAHDANLLLPLIANDGLNVLGAIAILLIGLWLSGKAHFLVTGLLSRAPHFDQMLVAFFSGIVRYLILTITVLAVLSQFGIQTTSLVAVLGAAGLAVGLALQGTLSNLAAGVMLLIFRPFRIGQSVQVGSVQGTVKEVSLFWTELVTGDNVQIIVPNNNVWGQPVRNYSFYPIRGIEAHFSLPADAKPDRALGAARTIIDADARITGNPAPSASLDLVGGGLEMVVNVWTASGNMGAVKSDLIKAIREVLDTEAIKEPAAAS